MMVLVWLRFHFQNRYNNIESDHSKRVLSQMDDIKDVMISNIDKILQRGEKLELVIDKTNDLADAATVACIPLTRQL